MRTKKIKNEIKNAKLVGLASGKIVRGNLITFQVTFCKLLKYNYSIILTELPINCTNKSGFHQDHFKI